MAGQSHHGGPGVTAVLAFVAPVANAEKFSEPSGAPLLMCRLCADDERSFIISHVVHIAR